MLIVYESRDTRNRLREIERTSFTLTISTSELLYSSRNSQGSATRLQEFPRGCKDKSTIRLPSFRPVFGASVILRFFTIRTHQGIVGVSYSSSVINGGREQSYPVLGVSNI